MHWSCLQFNIFLLPESYRRLSAETRGKPLSPSPLHGQGASLKTIPNQTPPHSLINVSKLASVRGSVASSVLFVVIQRSKLHTDSAEVPVLHTSVEVAKVRFSMTCSFVDGFVVLTISFSCGIVYSRGNRTPESENKQTSVYLIRRKMKKKCCIRTRTQETRPGALRSTALPHGSALYL